VSSPTASQLNSVDIELDIDRLKRRIAAGEVRVSEGRLVAPDREGERR
jgi:hypothetical protein